MPILSQRKLSPDISAAQVRMEDLPGRGSGFKVLAKICFDHSLSFLSREH